MNDLLKTLAPLLGTALGGPLGGAAATFIASKLGLDSADVKAVNEVLNSGKMTPDQVAQIKLAEIEFEKFLKQNQIDLKKLDIENTKSARDMQITTKSMTPSVLTYLITVGFFGILAYMMSSEYRASEPLLVMLGSLGTAWVACVNFWFGSSHGSAMKSDLLAQSSPVKS
jgi:hypothetical protein